MSKRERSLKELGEHQGTFGCIVDYATYRCPNDPVAPNEPMISKIMTDKAEFDNEVRIAEMLKGIEPNQNYLIYAKSACAIPKTDAENVCEGEHFDENSKVLYVLTMKNGGRSLEDFLEHTNEIPLSVSIRLINDILTGLSILHRAGIRHNDISPKNITVASIPDSQTMKRAYLIDFGKSNKDASAFRDLENAFELFSHILYKTEDSDERYYYKEYVKKPKAISMLPTLEQIKDMVEPPRRIENSGVARSLFD